MSANTINWPLSSPQTPETPTKSGIVTETSDEARLLDVALALAEPIAGKDRNVIGIHKRLLFGDAARVCGYEPAG